MSSRWLQAIVSVFMVIVMVMMVCHLSDEHGGQEHEDECLQEGHEEFQARQCHRHEQRQDRAGDADAAHGAEVRRRRSATLR